MLSKGQVYQEVQHNFFWVEMVELKETVER